MTTEYSISVEDWTDEKWEMTGRDLMYSKMEEKGTPQHKELLKRAKDCGCKPYEIIDEVADEHIPMMNYAYPLEIVPEEDKIIEVCERTCCSVVQDNNTGTYFLALCGGGMDLSQDVALAYTIVQKWLPISLLQNINTQYGLKSDKDFEQIADIIIEQTKIEISRLQETLKKWEAVKKIAQEEIKRKNKG